MKSRVVYRAFAIAVAAFLSSCATPGIQTQQSDSANGPTDPRVITPAPREAPSGYQRKPSDECRFYEIPIYPIKAIRAEKEGWVLIEYSVTESGVLKNTVIIDSSPKKLFDKAVLNMVERYNQRKVGTEPPDDKGSELMKAVGCKKLVSFMLEA